MAKYALKRLLTARSRDKILNRPWWPTAGIQKIPVGDVAPVVPFPKLSSLEQALTALAARPIIFVLALTRTGSKSALSYFHSSFSPSHRLLHAHGVSNRFQQSLLAPEKKERHARVDALLRSGAPTTVVVPVRASVPRIYSFYIFCNVHRLPEMLDQKTGEFRKCGEIQEDFAAFCLAQASWEERWYREELLDPFGFDFLSVPKDMAGAHVASVGGRTFIVLRCEIMTETLSSAAASVGGGRALKPLIPVNTSSDHGTVSLASAFRRQFEFPEAAMDVLRRNPYSHHLYPPTT